MTVEPLLVVAGPTASGKSRLGIEVAEQLGGEVVSADAFAVYRGLDIGTDKPSPEDRRRVPHHMIDVADPRQTFSAGDFAEQARGVVADIRRRGRVPVVVGGTMFYLRALILGLFPAPQRDADVRKRLTRQWQESATGLWRRLRSVDPEAAMRIDPRDRQRVVRAMEVYEITGRPMSEHWQRHRRTPRYRALVTVPERDRRELYARIDTRVDWMFTHGLVDEVRGILASGVPPGTHALKAIGYREVVELLNGDRDLETAIDRTKTASRRLAKKQLTWLRGLHEGVLRPVPPSERGGSEALVSLWHDHLKESERP